MAQSALQREVAEACRAFDEKRNPKAVKARRENSSERRRGRNIVRNLPTVEVLKVVRAELMKDVQRKQTAVRVKRWREKRRKALQFPLE